MCKECNIFFGRRKYYPTFVQMGEKVTVYHRDRRSRQTTCLQELFDQILFPTVLETIVLHVLTFFERSLNREDL